MAKKVLEIGRVIEFAVLKELDPIELIPFQYVPRDFRITFTYPAKDTSKLWKITLRVRTLADKIPRAIEVLITGNSTDAELAELEFHESVKSDQLSYVAQELRELEAVAVVECIKLFYFDPIKQTAEYSVSSASSKKRVRRKGLSEAEENKLRKIVLAQNAMKLTPESLREVAAVYLKASEERKRTNAAVKSHFDKKDDANYSIKTVRGWIAKSKPYRPTKPKKNSSPIKSVKDVRKPTTTKKSGESK